MQRGMKIPDQMITNFGGMYAFDISVVPMCVGFFEFCTEHGRTIEKNENTV